MLEEELDALAGGDKYSSRVSVDYRGFVYLNDVMGITYIDFLTVLAPPIAKATLKKLYDARKLPRSHDTWKHQISLSVALQLNVILSLFDDDNDELPPETKATIAENIDLINAIKTDVAKMVEAGRNAKNLWGEESGNGNVIYVTNFT